MIRIACPRCEERLVLDDEARGQLGQCPQCSAQFRIPGARSAVVVQPASAPARLPSAPPIALEPPAALPPDPEVAPRRRPRRRTRRSSNSAGAWVVIVGGVVGAVAVIGVGVWFLISLSHQKAEYSWSLDQGKKTDYYLRFTGGKKVEIWVTSELSSDVDLFVYDPNNRLVAVDEGDSKDCYVRFVASETQTYRVEVQNRVRLEPWQKQRNGPNRGTLRYQESAPGDHPNGVVPQQPPAVPPFRPRSPRPGPGMVQRAPQVIALQPGLAGAVYQGTLTLQDGRDAQHLNAFCQTITYPMSAGKEYVIDLKSTEFDAFLRLEDAGGRQLAQDDDSGGGHDARIVFRPPQDGTYRIVVTTFAPEQVGNYTLSIRQ
jgi:hypothetical protein